MKKSLLLSLLSLLSLSLVNADPAANTALLEKKFTKIQADKISGNIISMVGGEWSLITATDDHGKFNSMTASWGGLGVMWGMPVAFILVRNERYTYQFLEKGTYFTVSFYDAKYRPQLKDIFGTKSGRDTDKVKQSGFTPIDTGTGTGYLESKLIICCKKLYGDKIAEENAVPEQAKEWYFNGSKTYHKLYFGEIVAVWQKK